MANEFGTTHWSVVLAAGDAETEKSREALSVLCETYWPPLYSYIRRRGFSVEDSQDLTQEFFAQFIAHDSLRAVSPERGRFRSYLLACMNHFLANEWDKVRAKKRGSGRVPVSMDASGTEEASLRTYSQSLTPERVFDRRWAVALLESALTRLEASYVAQGRQATFRILQPYLIGDGTGLPYGHAARELGISEGGVKSSVHRLRRRYREALREEIAQTVAGAEDVASELSYLRDVLRG